MAGTRTAPAATGAATAKLLSFRWMDASGDVRTDSMYVPIATTAENIEALAVALQAGSNATLHSIAVESQWGSVPDADNATTGSKSESVFDQLFFVAKSVDPSKIVQRAFVPAPLALLFTADSDSLDPASGEIADILSAFLAVVGAGYAVTWGRYSERSEQNERLKI